MNNPNQIQVTIEVGYCPFCRRTRNLRREDRHLGALVRTNIACETCHRTLSSTMGVPDVVPEASPEPVVPEAAPSPQPEPEPQMAEPSPSQPEPPKAPAAPKAKKPAAEKAAKPPAANKASTKPR
jgi:hypothetical protein